MTNLLRNYGLSLALASLFLVSWLLHALFGWAHFAAEQREHGQTPQLFGDSGYFWAWMDVSMENWQSEFLQLFTMVVLTAFLIHKASASSRDSSDELKNMLAGLQEEVRSLRKGSAAPTAEKGK